MWFGNVTASDTITIPWDVVSLQSGSVTPTTAGSIVIYKNNSATQRTSASGVTDTRTFDSVTGTNLLTIDLSDNTDAGFYAAGNNYHVMVSGMVVEGLTINKWLASFSIQNRNDYADIREIGGSAVSTSTAQLGVNVVNFGGSAGTFASGRPEVNTSHIAGSAVSTSSAQIGVNVVNAGGTAWGSGAITAASIAASALNGKGDWNIGKTGYSLTATTGLGNQTANITGNLSGSVGSVTGAVGSVTGNVGGNVTGSVGSIATGGIAATSFAAGAIDATAIAADAITAAKVAADVTTEIQSGLATAASLSTVDTNVSAIKTKTDSLNFTVAGQVDANIQYVNDVLVTGTGASGDEWGP